MGTATAKVCLAGIRAVAFDLDDTLFPEQSYAFSGFAAVGEWLSSKLNCPFDPAERMRAAFLAGERRHVFDRVLADLGHPDPQAVIPEMIQCYRAHTPRIELYDDARTAIHAWRRRFRLGLISDGPLQMQEKKVAALGLASLLDEIVLTGQWDAAYWKPHPRPFELVQERLGLTGPSLVYIADNRGKDFVAPRLLRWRTVWISRPGGLYGHVPAPPGAEPESQISSLGQLDLAP